MHERRSQIRFLPRQPLDIALQIGSQPLTGRLADISDRGCLIMLPGAVVSNLAIGTALEGEFALAGGASGWAGRIAHRCTVRAEHGLGVRFQEHKADVVASLLGDRQLGGLRVSHWASGAQAEIVGHLGFNMHRQFLSLIRQRHVSRVELGACSQFDSAGLGLLKIASEHAIPIGGARGRIRDLLTIAGLHEPRLWATSSPRY